MQNKALFAIAAVFSLVTAACAQPVVVLGSHDLRENASGQTIQIFVSGGDAVQGMNFNVQVADGGPEAGAFGGTIDGPAITNVDIFTGTIFESNNTGQAGSGSIVPQVYHAATTTSTGTVSANGLLATITFDTTGFFFMDPVHSWDLVSSNTLNGPMDFGPIPATISDGTINVVPEPASMALLALGALAMIRRRKA